LGKIIVFNHHNQRVGETYSRRAKQLTLKNRAIWLDNDLTSIRLTNTAIAAVDAEEDKQTVETFEGEALSNRSYNRMNLRENALEDDSAANETYAPHSSNSVTGDDAADSNKVIKVQSPTSGIHIDTEHAEAPSADLILYVARRNVERRYSFLRHVIAWFVSFLVIFVITDGWSVGLSPSFYGGFFFAWGLLILYKCYILFLSWFVGLPKVQNIDPVRTEYARLKAIPPARRDIEFKRF